MLVKRGIVALLIFLFSIICVAAQGDLTNPTGLYEDDSNENSFFFGGHNTNGDNFDAAGNPLDASTNCVDGQEYYCTTLNNCPGTKRCEDGQYSECEDKEDDFCPAADRAFKIEDVKTTSCPAPLSNRIDWEQVDNAVQYKVYSCSNKECEPSNPVIVTEDHQFIHKFVAENTLYRYAIVAVSANNERIRSNNVKEITTNSCPVKICEPGEIQLHECIANARIGTKSMQCKSDGSAWIQITTCEIVQTNREETDEENDTQESEDQDTIDIETEHTKIETTDNSISKEITEPIILEETVELTDEEVEILEVLIQETETLQRSQEEKEEEIQIEQKKQTEELREAQTKAVQQNVKKRVLQRVKTAAENEEQELRDVRELDEALLESIDEIEISTIIEEERQEEVIEKVATKIIEREIERRVLQRLEGDSLNSIVNTLQETTENIDEKTVEDSITRVKAGFEIVKETKIEKKASVIEETNDEGEKEEITVVTVVIEPPKTKGPITIYEEIPKTIAQTASELIFYDKNVEIIDADPLIAWHFDEVPEELELRYGVKDVISADALQEAVTIPVGAIAGNVVDVPEQKKEFSKFQLLFPIIMSLFIAFLIIFFHKFAIRE